MTEPGVQSSVQSAEAQADAAAKAAEVSSTPAGTADTSPGLGPPVAKQAGGAPGGSSSAAGPPGEHAERKTGVVKWFNAVKGFGFVTPDEGGEDLFVHQSNIRSEGFRSLREGEAVEFEVEAGTDGRAKAINVTGPEGQAPQGAPPRSTVKSMGGMPMMGPMGGRGPMPDRGGRMDMGGSMGGAMGGGMGGGRGFFGYPPMPGPFSVGYYFPGGEDPTGRARGGRGRMGPGRGPPGPIYFPGGPVPGMPPGAMPMQQQAPAQSSGLQVVVHNLPWTCTWQQLKDHFQDFNVERADIVLDQFGRSRGFGTVRLSSPADADAACATLNNTKLEDRMISVRLDRFG